jgi:hypothetical protein
LLSMMMSNIMFSNIIDELGAVNVGAVETWWPEELVKMSLKM